MCETQMVKYFMFSFVIQPRKILTLPNYYYEIGAENLFLNFFRNARAISVLFKDSLQID